MFAFLVNILSIMITYPLLILPIIYIIFRIVRQERKIAFQHTTDIITLFLLFNIQTAIYITYQSKAFLWWYAIVMLLFFIILALLQYKLHGDFYPQRLFRAGWRLSFLVLLILHVVTVVLGIIYQYQIS